MSDKQQPTILIDGDEVAAEADDRSGMWFIERDGLTVFVGLRTAAAINRGDATVRLSIPSLGVTDRVLAPGDMFSLAISPLAKRDLDTTLLPQGR